MLIWFLSGVFPKCNGNSVISINSAILTRSMLHGLVNLKIICVTCDCALCLRGKMLACQSRGHPIESLIPDFCHWLHWMCDNYLDKAQFWNSFPKVYAFKIQDKCSGFHSNSCTKTKLSTHQKRQNICSDPNWYKNRQIILSKNSNCKIEWRMVDTSIPVHVVQHFSTTFKISGQEPGVTEYFDPPWKSWP